MRPYKNGFFAHAAGREGRRCPQQLKRLRLSTNSISPGHTGTPPLTLASVTMWFKGPRVEDWCRYIKWDHRAGTLNYEIFSS
jgi:hypothetical protein